MKSIQYLLFESHIHLLMEDYRLDKIKQIINKRLPERDRLNDEGIQTIINADPTSHGDGAGKYGEWLVKQYIQADAGYRKRFFEDLYKYTEALNRYHELKTRNKVAEKDINKIPDLYTLQDLVKDESQDSILQGFPDTRELESKGEVEVLLRDANIHIYWTKTHHANTILGSNTKWCTVPEDSSYFDDYDEDGPIFILYVKKGNKFERYQYHFESDQFMNEKDLDDQTYLYDEKVKQAFFDFARGHWGIDIAIWYLERGDDTLFKIPEMQTEILEKDAGYFQYIENPTREMQLEVVRRYGNAIKYIENPCEEVQLEAVKNDGYAIQYIKNPSEEIQLAAVRHAGSAIIYIKNPSEEIQLAAVRQDGDVIGYIKNPSEEIQLAAVRQDGRAIAYINNPNEVVQLAAVKQNIYAFGFIENPSENVKMARDKSKR